MTFELTYQYRLFPTRAQERSLHEQLTFARSLYNAALEQRRSRYRETGEILFYKDQSKQLPEIRRDDTLAPKDMSSWTQQHVLHRLERAFNAAGTRHTSGETAGWPRFKAANRFRTLTWTFAGHAGGIHIGDKHDRPFRRGPLPKANPARPRPSRPRDPEPHGGPPRLHLKGVGPVKVRWHRDLPDDAALQTATVLLKNGCWYVNIRFDITSRPVPRPRTGKQIGIDLGVINFIATSDGDLLKGPRTRRSKHAKHLAKAQRIQMRRQIGSKRRVEQSRRVARAYAKMANVRKDHAHKLSRELVDTYDLIAHEDLNLRALMRSYTAKDVQDAAWGRFIRNIRFKAASAGVDVIAVDPRNTSRTCNACGHIDKASRKNETFACVSCTWEDHADVNAAKNILGAGLALRGGTPARPAEARSRRSS